MATYGYVSGFYKDNISKQDDFEHQAKILLNMGIPYDHPHKNKSTTHSCTHV